MSLNVIFSFLFPALSLQRIGWMPHGGLALANSLATAIEAPVLLVLMRRRLAGLTGRRSPRGWASSRWPRRAWRSALLFWINPPRAEPLVIGLGGVEV